MCRLCQFSERVLHQGVLAMLLGCGVLFGSANVSAQNAVGVSEADFLNDMPTVISVSRLRQRLDETPGAVTILDRDTIRRSGARDVADLMRLVPGFQVSTSFESVAPLVSYHGAFDSYSNRLELLIDGRSVYSPYFIGSIGPGLQTVALEDIERIEVLRGSNSAAYGARAILGVINIVTRHTADTLGAQGALTAGENGVRDAQARIGWGDDRGTFRLNVDSRADDGLTGANGHNRVSRLNFRADVNPVPGDELQIRLGAMSIFSGKGFAGNVDNDWRDASFDTSFAQLDYKRVLNANSDLSLKLSHSQEDYQDEYPYSLLPYGINDVYMVRGSGQASSDSLALQYTQRHSEALRSVVGGEFRSERIVSSALYNTDAPFMTDFTRLFGNVEWRVSSNWLVNAGAMAEKSSVTGSTVSPRVMLNWHVTPGQTLRAGVSKAFRPASNYENFADRRFVWNGYLLGINTLSRGNLQPETVVASEIGYLGDFPKQGLSVDLRLFNEQINRIIRQHNTSLPRYYVNEEDFPIQGVEYQVKWKPWQGTQLVWNQSYVNIDASLTRPGGLSDELNGNSLAAPKLSSSLVYSQQLPQGWDVTLAHHDYGTAVLAGSGVGSQVAITRTDIRLAKAMRWGTRRGEVALVVQNLGLPYPDFDPAFSFERRAFVTLRLEN